MSEQIVTKPIIKDETGQQMLDKLDEIISALNPNAQGVSFDKTGCEIITANNVQDALEQLDSGLDDTNSNLANYYSDSLTKNDGGNYIKTEYAKAVYRYNLIKIVHVSFNFKAVSAGGSWKTIYNIPQGFLPINSMSVMCISRYGLCVQFRATSEGNVQFYSTDAITDGDLISCEIVCI